MSLREQLAAHKSTQRGPRCSICKLLPMLSEDDRMVLEEAMASNMASAQIQRAILAEGHNIGRGSVARHRRGDCAGL